MFDNDISFIFAQTINSGLFSRFMIETTESIKRNLPDASTVLVLGILSLVFSFSCVLLGLVLGIIAVVLASGQQRIYRQNPGEYTDNSLKNVSAGRVCGIVSICLSAVLFVFMILLYCGLIVFAISAATFGL